MGRAFGPGRVNLIGDHTDYAGGLALPMAVDMGTTVDLSADDSGRLRVETDAPVEPGWERYVAAVMFEMDLPPGASGEVTTTLPVGAGLSSSAALEVATALALGFEGSDLELAKLCQRAEERGSGVPCGLMDQLTCVAAVDGSALLIDFEKETVRTVSLPDEATVFVVHSGIDRQLVGSEYADRRLACEAAAAAIGPLRDATLDEAMALTDPLLSRRARHVVTENLRVLDFASAVAARDLATAGDLMLESHVSLRDDFEVSHPALDDLVTRLSSTPGVHGARLTGAGFGGCVVALADADVADADIPHASAGMWRVRPAAGARRLV